MTWRYGTHCYASLGQLALLRGDADAARRFAEQSLEMAPPASSPKYEGWAWRIRGESAVARRAWGEAEDALRRALAIAEAIGQPRQTGQTHAGLARRPLLAKARPARASRSVAVGGGRARVQAGGREPRADRVFSLSLYTMAAT